MSTFIWYSLSWVLASCSPVAVCLIRALIFGFGFYSHRFGQFIASSDCIILSALRWENREREAISCSETVLFYHSVPHLQSYGSLLCPSEGEAGALPLSSSGSAQPALAQWLQWVSRFCIPTLFFLFAAFFSQRWDSSCCCLALIWCSNTHNAFPSVFASVQQNLYFRQSWLMQGKSCHFLLGCLFLLWKFFTPDILASSNKLSQQLLFCFVLATSHSAIIN